MLQKTTALVLHTTPYGETSVIGQLLTRQMGVRSYIFKGVRSERSRTKRNMLQPLTHLDMVVYDKPHVEINYVKEMRIASQWNSLETEPTKTALRFFGAEALYRSLRRSDPMPILFDYVVTMLEHLNETEDSSASYPIEFLIGLSHHLGIQPMDNYSESKRYFSIIEGRFDEQQSELGQIGSEMSLCLHQYLHAFEHNAKMPKVPLSERRQLLQVLIEYYQTHLAEFKNFKSHEILHTVLQ